MKIEKLTLIVIITLALTLIIMGINAGDINQTVNVNQQGKMDINTATAEELKTLPGVGDTLADRIIRGRPYTDIWELSQLEGIGAEIMNNIRDYITVSSGGDDGDG